MHMSKDYAAHRTLLKALQISIEMLNPIIQNPDDPIACLFVLFWLCVQLLIRRVAENEDCMPHNNPKRVQIKDYLFIYLYFPHTRFGYFVTGEMNK